MATPIIHSVTRRNGIAGQYEITADVQYPDEPTRKVSFVSSVYGGPIVMTTEHSSVFVSREALDRLGESLTVGWVYDFFGKGE